MVLSRKSLRIFLPVLVVVIAGWFWLSTRYVTPVLMYHHISSDPGHYVHPVNPERFADQMKYLDRHGYHVVSAADYAEALIQGRQLPRKSVVLTFDDGYEDNYLNAFPVLKQYGFQAVFFILSDVMGGEGQMTEDQIRQMAASGMQIGSHTRRHAYLPDVKDPARLTDEIAGSKSDLEKKIGSPVDFFCYPVGGYNSRIREEVRKAGYQAAFTTNRGSFRNTDRWAITRIKVTDKDRGFVFGVKLSGFYNLFRTPRKPDQPMHDKRYDSLFVGSDENTAGGKNGNDDEENQ